LGAAKTLAAGAELASVLPFSFAPFCTYFTADVGTVLLAGLKLNKITTHPFVTFTHVLSACAHFGRNNVNTAM
jgi:hypothetical protein